MVSQAPQNVILQTGNGQNLISWNYSIGAASYDVQRSVDGLTFASIGTSLTNGYVDASALIGVNYYYQVGAVNGDGTSSYSASFPNAITPCLPGQINLGYIRYMAQLAADKLNSFYLTLDEWNFNINQSSSELYDMLVLKYGDDYMFAPPLILTPALALTDASGIQYYALPDGANYSASPAFYKLNGIDINLSGGGSGPNTGWVPLARMNWSDRNKYSGWSGTSGVLLTNGSMGYREMGNRLYIFPQNLNLLMRMWYVPIRVQMLLDTDMLPFSISGWSEYVIVDAAMKAMRKEESNEKWQVLAQTKSGLIERIEQAAANRDVGQPNSISNTRATMGDPGFTDWNNAWGNGMSGWGGF